MPHEFEREHYRIEYPTQARPQVVFGGGTYQVMDISERGMRCRLESGMVHAVGEELSGVVRFRRGEEIEVAGRVIRVTPQDMALRLSVGVPFRIVLEEQRYLREHHRGSAW